MDIRQKRLNMYYSKMFVLLLLLLETIELADGVTINKPPSGGVTITKFENTTGGIYPLEATDPLGNVPIFTILSQTPSTPVFTISSTDDLTVPSVGLDAETTTQFTFTFSVTAGSNSATSGTLTLNVTDVNDNDPVFKNTPYTGEVWKNDPAGTTIITVTAIDPDISNLPIATYSISGSQTAFAVDSSGVITVSNAAGLAPLSSPTVLQVQASDGAQTGSAAVTITVNEDPCTSDPCQNGGTCTSARGTHTCSCVTGYTGTNCQLVDYCYQGPCKNGATCISQSTTYNCSCPSCWTDQNCTTEDHCCPSPCKNGGTCTSLPTGPSCTCPSSCSGENCEICDGGGGGGGGGGGVDGQLIAVCIVAGVCLCVIIGEVVYFKVKKKSDKRRVNRSNDHSLENISK